MTGTTVLGERRRTKQSNQKEKKPTQKRMLVRSRKMENKVLEHAVHRARDSRCFCPLPPSIHSSTYTARLRFFDHDANARACVLLASTFSQLSRRHATRKAAAAKPNRPRGGRGGRTLERCKLPAASTNDCCMLHGLEANAGRYGYTHARPGRAHALRFRTGRSPPCFPARLAE